MSATNVLEASSEASRHDASGLGRGNQLVRPLLAPVFDVRPFNAGSGAPGAARRLGRALRASREATRLSTTDVARRSNGWFLPRHVRDVEAGRRRLSDGELRFLIGLYGVRLADQLPARVSLRLQPHGPGDTPERAEDVLVRYLALLMAFRYRRRDPATVRPARLVLRNGDIDVLAASLDLSPNVLRETAQAVGRREHKHIVALADRIRAEIRVDGCEILVGVMLRGVLVFEDRGGRR